MKETKKDKKIDNDILYKRYVGSNYDRFNYLISNIGTLLLGGAYYLYRKIYLFGFIIIIVTFLLQLLLSFIPAFFVIVFVNFILAFITNKIYLKYVRKKVDKIIKDNPDMSSEELKILCIKKGGTSVGFAVFGFIVSLILFFFVVSTPTTLFIKNSLTGGITNDKDLYKVIDYDFYNASKSNSRKYFKVKPTELFVEHESKNDYEFVYKINGNNNIPCLYTLYSIPDISASTSEIIESIQKHYKKAKAGPENIVVYNGIRWHYVIINNDLQTSYYYLTKDGNTVYVLEYMVIDNRRESAACHNNVTETIEGITRK